MDSEHRDKLGKIRSFHNMQLGSAKDFKESADAVLLLADNLREMAHHDEEFEEPLRSFALRISNCCAKAGRRMHTVSNSMLELDSLMAEMGKMIERGDL